MRNIVVISLVVLFGALISAGLANSQTSTPEPLDLGESNLLTLTCDFVRGAVNDNGYPLKYCRRREPEEVNGNTAIVKITFKVGPDVVTADVRLKKSLWNVEGAVVK